MYSQAGQQQVLWQDLSIVRRQAPSLGFMRPLQGGGDSDFRSCLDAARHATHGAVAEAQQRAAVVDQHEEGKQPKGAAFHDSNPWALAAVIARMNTM